ncbi:MAG TPA: sigma-70 family RNA polymerase sigma factor, partial [Methylomirabilota bacterium]|nr:sigma-70 family RNA polymerase sigma factor [Methylomirabilota bacterium]
AAEGPIAMLTGSCHSAPDLGATMETETEATLIDRLRGGDTTALEGLMEQFAPRVFRLAVGITHSQADAEEVVQDVFLSLFRKIGTFEGRAALGTWIYRITVNAALIKRRGKRVEREVLLEDHLPTFREDGHREGDRALLLADWSEAPDAVLLSTETRRLVRGLIASLPDHYRTVLLLRDLEELSNEETAEILGDSVASIKSRLHRARMALRELVTRSLRPGGPLPPGGRLGEPERAVAVSNG